MTNTERQFGFAHVTSLNSSPDPTMEMLCCIGRYPVRMKELACDVFGEGANIDALYPLIDRAKLMGFEITTSNARGGRVAECAKRYVDMRDKCKAYWRQRDSE